MGKFLYKEKEIAKNVAVSGGTSQATNIRYNNESSELESTTVQGAIDEIVDDLGGNSLSFEDGHFYIKNADGTVSKKLGSGGGTASASQVLSGVTFSSDNYEDITTGTMTNRGAVNQTLNTSTTSYTVPVGYHNGSGTVSISTQTKSVTPSTTAQDITPDSGKVLSKVTVKGVSVSLPAAGNILTGSSASVSSNGTALGSVSGSMANKGGTNTTGTITFDNSYIYIVPSASGYYNTSSKIYANIANAKLNNWLFKEGTGKIVNFTWTKGAQPYSGYEATSNYLYCYMVAKDTANSTDIRSDTIRCGQFTKCIVDFEMTDWQSDIWGPYFYINGKSVYKVPITSRKIIMLDIPSSASTFNFWSIGAGNLKIYNIFLA